MYDKLASQLESMEAHNSSPDVDRVSELLKVRNLFYFVNKIS